MPSARRLAADSHLIRSGGLTSFENDQAHNPGRINIYSCDGVTVVLDFAHNEIGLKHLIEFGRGEVRTAAD